MDALNLDLLSCSRISVATSPSLEVSLLIIKSFSNCSENVSLTTVFWRKLWIANDWTSCSLHGSSCYVSRSWGTLPSSSQRICNDYSYPLVLKWLNYSSTQSIALSSTSYCNNNLLNINAILTTYQAKQSSQHMKIHKAYDISKSW